MPVELGVPDRAKAVALGQASRMGEYADGGAGSSAGAPLSARERRRLVTAVFCDLSGSTALAERVDGEAVFGLMRSYFEAAQAALERHGGLVEKFIGDAVVGVFGMPEAHEDDALRACRAALELQERVETLNEDLEARYRIRLAVRIGVNTGEVITGEIGGRPMFAGVDSVVVGDTMNTAARLEQASAPGEVLIGESTRRLVRAAAELELREPVRAKGKAEPLAAYRLIGVRAPGQAQRQAAAPLAGREDELAVLLGAFAEVEAGSFCRLVTVVGEPGIGKSRLAAEFLERVGGARIARGACLSYGEGITYWPVGEVVRELLGIRDAHSLATARAEVDAFLTGSPDGPAVAAQIAQLLGLAGGSTTPEELAWAIGRFLAAGARDRPLVLVIDDLQWAERVLLDVLAGLPRALPGLPVLVVCLARPELLEDRAWPVTVRLGPLAHGAVEVLLAILGTPPALREKLIAAAAGNPLFAEELVATLADQGLLDADEAPGVEEIDLPIGINALLSARLDLLDAGSRAALERGAVEGELFHQGAVVELSEHSEREAVPFRLDDLARRDFVSPAVGTVAGESAFRFKHLLVREAAYRATAKNLRAGLHERFADWLERVAGDRLVEYEEILGYHLEQAYRYRSEIGALDPEAHALGERAAAHLASAAWRARALGDFDAAARLLERGLAIGFAEPHLRVGVQTELGSVLGQTRRTIDADAVLTEAYETATRLGERNLAAWALVRRGWNRTGQPTSTPAGWQAEAEEAIATLTELGDDRGLSDARRLRALGLANLRRSEEARSELELALENAEKSGDSEQRRSVINTLANVYIGGPTPVSEAIGLCERLSDTAAGDRVLEASLQRSLGVLYAMAARPREAVDALARGAAVLDEVRLRRHEVYRVVVAYARKLCGDRDGAERELRMMWEYFRDVGRDFDTRAWNASNRLAALYCDEGRFDDAADFHAYGRKENGGERPHPRWLSVEAMLAAGEGRLVQAARLAARSIVEAETDSNAIESVELLAAAARVQRAAGLPVEAEAAIQRALAICERKENRGAAARLGAGALAPM